MQKRPLTNRSYRIRVAEPLVQFVMFALIWWGINMLSVSVVFAQKIMEIRGGRPVVVVHRTAPKPNASVHHAPQETANLKNNAIGQISARYESGSAGSQAIGYDPAGGTSYGRYQIASRPGSLRHFLHYAQTRAPDWAEQLSTAGPFNTGSRTGQLPTVWRALAKRHGARFDNLQHDFIMDSYYLPAHNVLLQRTGFDIEAQSPAIREAFFSTSVQHGAAGASDIFASALSQTRRTQSTYTDAALLSSVYKERKERITHGSSATQSAVLTRLVHEENDVRALTTATPRSSAAQNVQKQTKSPAQSTLRPHIETRIRTVSKRP
ncbi:hypothetical protein [Desulfovibrio inopinatus]|uniref:VgrG-related protein n=1 Tax=Desulfovibrio inopinatus TaxID=102109 RepID=UPI0004248704|nr:hypothetical protein [Desulfovibrio inopinatus]